MVSPGPTANGSPSSTICSPVPDSTYSTSSEPGWLCLPCPSPGCMITSPNVRPAPGIVAGLTNHLIIPQSKLSVGIAAASIAGIHLAFRPYRLEPPHVLGYRDLRGEPPVARRAEEPDHPRHAF